AGGDGVGEGIEVDHHQVEGGDVVLGELGTVRFEPLIGEDAAVDAGVEGLHASVEDLGEAGDGLDLGDGDAGLVDGGGGRSGRDDLGAAVGQRTGQLDDPGLVEDGDQGAADGSAVGGGHGACSCRVVSW